MHINREVVSTAMSILDRYLAIESVSARTFKLVSLSSFHIASKILLKKHLPVVSCLRTYSLYFSFESENANIKNTCHLYFSYVRNFAELAHWTLEV